MVQQIFGYDKRHVSWWISYKAIFFNTLYDIKSHYCSDVKVLSSFLNWLNSQIQIREDTNDLSERDREQIDFNNELKESRYNIFGNPVVDRIKYFNYGL